LCGHGVCVLVYIAQCFVYISHKTYKGVLAVLEVSNRWRTRNSAIADKPRDEFRG